MDDRSLLVLAATVAAGPVADDPASWQERVLSLVGDIAGLASPAPDGGTGGAGWMIADAILGESTKNFSGVLHSVDYEAISKRYLVKIKTQPSKRYPDGIEPARTERTYLPAGRAMARRVKAIPIGSKVRVWKAIENIDADTKVRLLAHITLDDDAAPQRPSTGQPAGPSPATDRAPAAARPVPSGEDGGEGNILEQINALPNQTKVRVMAIIRREELDITPSNEQAIRQIIDDIQRGST